MKAASTALAALINGSGGLVPIVKFDLYTISLAGGGLLTYTTADFRITAANNTIWDAPKIDGSGNLWTPGITWEPKVLDPSTSKAIAHWKTGLDTDQWQFAIAPRPFDIMTGAPFPDTIGGMPWLQAAKSGALDNADVIVSRAYFAAMPTHPIPVVGLSPVGCLTIFRGMAGEVDCTTSAAYVTCNDYKSLLSQQMPRNVYQGSCRHRVYDSRCTLNAATYTKTGAAAAGTTRGNIVASVAAPGGSATFTLGTLTMTSGNNAGFSRMVARWSGSAFALLNPFPFDVAVGDTFSVTAGCDKTQATCTLFSNINNFGGYPYIPIPEVSLG